MSSANGERLDAVGLPIEGKLFAADAGRGFHRYADDERVSVREASVNAAGVIRGGRTLAVDDRVVVLRTTTLGYGKTGSESDAFNGRNGKQQVGNEALGRVEEGLAQAARKPLDTASNATSYRVTLGACCGYDRLELRRIGFPSD